MCHTATTALSEPMRQTSAPTMATLRRGSVHELAQAVSRAGKYYTVWSPIVVAPATPRAHYPKAVYVIRRLPRPPPAAGLVGPRMHLGTMDFLLDEIRSASKPLEAYFLIMGPIQMILPLCILNVMDSALMSSPFLQLLMIAKTSGLGELHHGRPLMLPREPLVVLCIA